MKMFTSALRRQFQWLFKAVGKGYEPVPALNAVMIPLSVGSGASLQM
jgi:hypothetical protein